MCHVTPSSWRKETEINMEPCMSCFEMFISLKMLYADD